MTAALDHIGGPARRVSEQARRLTRQETHDLSMIIKDRTRVLKAHVEEHAARCLEDFEANLATRYAAALKAAQAAQEVIERRCEEMGIPKTFAPRLCVMWQDRGENALAERRVE